MKNEANLWIFDPNLQCLLLCIKTHLTTAAQFGAEAGNIKSTDLMWYRQCQSVKTLFFLLMENPYMQM